MGGFCSIMNCLVKMGRSVGIFFNNELVWLGWAEVCYLFDNELVSLFGEKFGDLMNWLRQDG